MNSVNHIGPTIQGELDSRGWNIEDLDHATRLRNESLRVPHWKIRKIINGEVHKVCVDDAIALADSLELPLEDFLRGPDWREPEIAFTYGTQSEPALAGATQ